jgi:hypothetical protein
MNIYTAKYSPKANLENDVITNVIKTNQEINLKNNPQEVIV